MAWPTFFALVQVIGCPTADADRVGALIDLEVAGARIDAVEVRCGARVSVTVKAGDRRAKAALPGDALRRDGGARLVALAAADLADQLGDRPAPAPAPPPTQEASPRPSAPARWQIAGALVGRTGYDDWRLATGLAGRWISGRWLVELTGDYSPTLRRVGGPVDSESRLARLSLASGVVLGAADGLQVAGIAGWSAGWGWLRGVDPGGMRIGPAPIGVTVAGPVGGPFLGARLLRRFGAGFAGLTVDQGWTAWTVVGTFFGARVDAFDGAWSTVGGQMGVEF